MRGPLRDSEPSGNAPSSQPSPRTRGEGVARLQARRHISIDVCHQFGYKGCESPSSMAVAGDRRSAGRMRFCAEAVGRLGEKAVERREAPRARSRRFAQADRSVARATPEARAGGNIRPRGVAHDPGASRRSISPFGEAFLEFFGQSSDADAPRDAAACLTQRCSFRSRFALRRRAVSRSAEPLRLRLSLASFLA